MKLYLSSYRIPTPKTLITLLEKKPEETTLAIIINAKDYRPEPERTNKLNKLMYDLNQLGFKNVHFISLLDYSREDLVAVLAKFDALYLAGGDSYALRYAMKKSGFDDSIEEYLGGGGVYIGESAGAFCAGITLEKGEGFDEPIAVPEIYYDGLHLVNSVVVPHADNIDYIDNVNKMVAYFEDKNISTIVLNDDQAYVVNGDNFILETGGGKS
ncbi:Type 1 glutamine amidotransferase-like domain-containing protein [Candidatus Saccharibacteria bacterium]|nr:Type 1 glutamine amidotransferase-like domain-containing protein [Candidatus Saccharibacteria bacterium]